MARRGDYYNGGYGRNERRRGGGEHRRSTVGLLVDGTMLLLSALAGVALALTLLSPYIHPARCWIFPVLGLMAPVVYIGTTLVTLYWIVRWRWKVAAPLVLLLILGLFKMPLFLKPELRRQYDTKPKYGAGTITLMTYNVRGFYDERGKWSFDSVARLVRRVDPDILCIQEFNRSAAHAGGLDSLLPDYTRTSVPIPDAETGYWFRTAVYTKYRVLGESQPILLGGLNNGQSIRVDLRIGDDTLRVVNNHLHSTSITTRDDQYLSHTKFLTDTAGGRKVRNIFSRFSHNSVVRADQADTIARAIADVRVPLVMCGDFNDTPLSYVYRTLSRGLSDAFSEQGKGYGCTFQGFLDALRIDYVLFNERLECLSYEVLDEVKLSDHYPVVVRLKIRP